MTSIDGGQSEDKELLERYRRASDVEPSAPTEGVRAAILAESRRIALELQKQGGRHTIDVTRPAANDSRWKITAFGTIGAALLAALLIAPRYWETLPASKNGVQAVAPVAARQIAPSAAPAPEPESVAPTASSDALPEVTVTQANRRRSNAAEIAAKPSPVSPRDSRQSNAAAPMVAQSYGSSPAARAAAGSASNTLDRLGSLGSLSPTLLQSAAQSGDVVQTTQLLDHGAAVDSRDAQGRTPLMLAIAQDRLAVVRLLLQRGADPNLADYSGKTLLQQATDQNLMAIVALLRNAGAH